MTINNKIGVFRVILSMVVMIAFGVNFNGGVTAEASSYTQGVVQTTQYGQVQGYEANEGKTLIWKGVPYAKAPEGALRWKAPEDPDLWTGVFDATQSDNIGIQLSGGKIVGSEDCLNLDIYRPNSDEIDLPILLYIHGGNNQTGTSAGMNAQQLVVHARAVVVSINYRLGLLGFNNLPALRTGNPQEDSGNYTVLDIAKSLDWVKDNIASFGGNPDNITISGFSAGGRDVMALLISPIVAGKFQKAISFSGGMTLADYDASAQLIAAAIAPLVVEDKVKDTEEEAYAWLLTDAQEVREYLYHLSADRLAGLMTNAGIRMAVFPHLYNDGTVLPKEGFRTERYNDVPLIMVTGSQEFSLFTRFDQEFASIADDILISDPDVSRSYQFAKQYGSQLYGLFNAQESAEKMFDKYDAPIYTCDFDWGTDADIVGEKMAVLFGSFHGIWIPFLTHETTGFSSLEVEYKTGRNHEDRYCEMREVHAQC
jgi:para-nitrobenzyl esterase